ADEIHERIGMLIFVLYLLKHRPPNSACFPCTTLFRSGSSARRAMLARARQRGRYRRDAPCRAARCREGARPARPTRLECSFPGRSEEHTSELQSREKLVCRLLLEKKIKSILSSLV